MIKVAQSFYAPSPDLSLDDFKQDEPFPNSEVAAVSFDGAEMIVGVSVAPLNPHADKRGSLCELLTTRDGAIEPIVHVYQVTADAGSCRAWVYHCLQHDRLGFASGSFRIVLYDFRPGSQTFGLINVFKLGRDRPALLRIPPYVAHGVQNIGRESATFINLPTKAWNPNAPDKRRLPQRDPRIPFSFD